MFRLCRGMAHGIIGDMRQGRVERIVLLVMRCQSLFGEGFTVFLSYSASSLRFKPDLIHSCAFCLLSPFLLLGSCVDTLYTFWDHITHYKTESVHFLGLMNSATKFDIESRPPVVGGWLMP